MRDEGLPAPGFLTVITPNSAPRLKQIVDLFLEMGANMLNINFVQPLGRAGEEWAHAGFTPHERVMWYKHLLDYLFSLWKQGHFVGERLFHIAILKVVTGTDTGFTDFRNPCGLAISQLAYGVDGTIHCCDEGRSCGGFSLGSVFRDHYKEVIRSPRVRQLLAESMPNRRACAACAYKPFCVVCPVLRSATRAAGTCSDRESQCALSRFLFDYAFNTIIDEWAVVNSYLIAMHLTAFRKDR